MKQSVRTQLERSHAETRKYVDQAMMVSAGLVVEMLDDRIKEHVDQGIKNAMRVDGKGGLNDERRLQTNVLEEIVT